MAEFGRKIQLNNNRAVLNLISKSDLPFLPDPIPLRDGQVTEIAGLTK